MQQKTNVYAYNSTSNNVFVYIKYDELRNVYV